MTVRTLRLLTLTLITGLLMVLSATTATAAELEDYLAEAAEASYAGEQATWSSFEGRTEFSVVSIEHAGSVLMVESGGSSQVLGGGRTSGVGADNGVALTDWSLVALADRYETVAATSAVRLGREVVVVTVNEDDDVRARIWFDGDTGAALGSEVYDDVGELFRLSWMIDFDANPRRVFTVPRDGIYDVVVTANTDTVADTLAGYEHVDTYAGPNDSVHAFYSDGLFAFSLFLIDGEGATGPFVEAEMMQLAIGDYRWILTPSELWVQWSGDGMTYVLVGDLPPDHLEEVLAQLPRPTRANILSRIWNGIFG